MLVDDQTANRRLFVEQLTGWGLTATAVDGGRAALDALTAAAGRGEAFEIVLLDANMPGLDGFGVAEEIARGPKLTSAIVMMLPASAHEGDVARCRELGIAASVMKPIQGLELRETIGRVLRARPSSSRGSRPRFPAKTACAAMPGGAARRGQPRQSTRGARNPDRSRPHGHSGE